MIGYTYLLMLMNLLTGYWKNHLESMNMKVDEENGKAAGIVNGQYQKVRSFQAMNFGRTLVVSFQITHLSLWG